MGGEILHASSVSVGDQGLLILGKSGAGKSSLALDLIALGAIGLVVGIAGPSGSGRPTPGSSACAPTGPAKAAAAPAALRRR